MYRLCKDKESNRRLCEALDKSVGLVIDRYPQGVVRAVVLTGSMARGEGSALIDDKGVLRVYGDIEMLVVFDDNVDIVEQGFILKGLSDKATNKLKEIDVLCEVEFGPAPKKYFAQIKPHIFGFELKAHGKVVWGDKDVLDTIEDMNSEDMPREDAWMLLSNRVVEQLLCLEKVMGLKDRAEIDGAVYYNHCKIILDIATSILVFTGMYRPSYEQRAELIEEAVNSIDSDLVRSGLIGFPEKVRRWTEIKLNPALLDEYVKGLKLERGGALSLWKELVPFVKTVWIWETNLLMGCDRVSDERRLAEMVLSREGLSKKLKGWARLVLNPKISKNVSFFKHMTGNILRGSPRYLVYISSMLLYFSIPQLLEGGNDKDTLDFIGKNIPVRFDPGKSSNWQVARTELVKGWQVYLRNAGV